MKRTHIALAVALILFAVIWGLFLPNQLTLPASDTFADDADAYNRAAVNIVTHGFYSVDGEIPHRENEPIYPLFLSVIYAIFGLENRFAVFLVHALLYVTAVLLFANEFRKLSSDRTAILCVWLLLLAPSVFHMIFHVTREIFTASTFLLFSASFLVLMRERSWLSALLSGLWLSLAINSYIVFLFFPIVVLFFFWLYRIPGKFLLPMLIPTILFLGTWGVRNSQYGDFRLAFSTRSVWTWTMRATRAETMTFADPYRCLWAEYIARGTWPSLKPMCERVWVTPNSQWPQNLPSYIDDVPGLKAVEKEKKRIILSHFPIYTIQSVPEFVEFHFPYVDGWGRVYNLSEAIFTAIIYLGCLLFLVWKKQWRREYTILLLIALYAAGIFALTNGLPRFRMPVVFCYATFAALGFDALLRRFQTRNS